MYHHPSCPNYRQPAPCAVACQMMQPLQPYCTSVYSLPGTSIASIAPPPLLMSSGPVQSTQTIRESIVRAADRLDHLSRLCNANERDDRRVHFQTTSRRTHRDNSMSADGAYDIECERDRTQRRSAPMTIAMEPKTQLQIQAPPPDVVDEPILRSILRPVAKVIRDHKSSQQLVPVQPTVYIVTFSADTVSTRRNNVARLLDAQLPARSPPIPHLYTIDARNYMPPSARVCERYSGISPVVQDMVMQDRKARHSVQRAVQELVAFGLEERQKAGGRKEVSMSVCCHMGTHRSVAIGERIAQGIKAEVGRLGLEEGVRVVVRHVHRIKGRGDPF